MIEYVMYNKSIVDSINVNNEYLVLAKKSVFTETSSCKIKTLNGKIIDPNETTQHEIKKGNTTFVKVKPEVYDTYVKFLQNKTKVPLRSIERLIDG